MNSISELIRAATILRKYSKEDADHAFYLYDGMLLIHVGIMRKSVSSDDLIELEELGWYYSYKERGFYKEC